jgi:hypothetical protein
MNMSCNFHIQTDNMHIKRICFAIDYFLVHLKSKHSSETRFYLSGLYLIRNIFQFGLNRNQFIMQSF